MGVSSPMPSSLPKECIKATQIFNSFATIIPQEILRSAKGFAILTIAKAGFLFSARAGTGLVIVKLPDGTWSAPSAVGTGGVGVGGQAGAELSEFVIILNSRAAVQSFMSNGSINLGGNLSVAVGPIGRNAEASGSINKFATMYSYSRTRGLFGGASLEGSVIMERNDANTKAYRQFLDDYYPGEVNARMLLSGNMPPPTWAQGLISAIERRVGTHMDSTWVDDEPSDHEERRNRGYSFGSEYARQSSANSPRKGDNGNDYGADYDDGDEPSDRRHDDGGPPIGGGSKDRMAYMANQYKGRLRGYSLGSFGRSKSGSGSGTSTPTKKGGARDRSYSTATPRTRYDIDGDEYVDDDYNDYRTQRGTRRQTIGGGRGGDFDDEDYNGPPTGTSRDIGSASKSSKFTDFMKRPVLPSRKSTSAVQSSRNNSSSGKDSPTSRWRPGSSMAKREKNRLQYGGRYDSDEGRYGRNRPPGEDDFDAEDTFNGRSSRRPAGPDSPFGDQFTQVEHRFSSEVEDDDRDAFRSSTTSRNGNGNSGNNTRSRMMQSMSRPLTKRSATAPLSRNGRSSHNDIDLDDGLEEIITRTNKVNLSFGTKFDENTARQSFDSYDTAGRPSDIISIGDGSNPFDEDHAATSSVVRNSASHAHNGRGNDRDRDLLSTLDDDLPSGSSFSDVEKPLHRLESRNATGYGGDRLDRDDSSIRSFDSSKEYMVVGQKAHRIPLHVKQVDNDLSQPLSQSQYKSAPDNFPKEWRVATFDFEGGQAGDLSFKLGEIIEIIDKQDPDWYTGRIGSRQGIVPVNRTQIHQA